MSRGPLRVFVSSSMEELKEERAALHAELEGLKFKPFVFEFLGADPKSPRENYVPELKSADVYIGIFWKKYGDYTIEEFELAVKYDKPCFIYIKTKDEQDREKKLSEFLDENFCDVDEGITFFNFEETDKFIDQVQEDLLRWLTDNIKEPTAKKIPQIQFVNRSEELRRILSDFGPAYPLIIGPLGYGKTRLLQELKIRFEDAGWLAHYSEADRFVNKQVEFKDFINELSDQVLTSKENKYQKGLVLLLDLVSPEAQGHFPILMETIKDRREFLRQRRKFFDYERDFKVVFASRYSLSDWEHRQPLLGFEPIPLSTFTFDIIQESIGRYMDISNEYLGILSAHVMYLTGGHPDCVSQIVKTYKNVNETVDTFISENFKKIISNIVLPVIKEIEIENVHSLNSDVNLFVNSNVLRCIYAPVLQGLIDHHFGKYEAKDGFSLSDKLTTSKLFTKKTDTSLIEDGLLRRLFAIRLWYMEPDKFIDYCETAQELCLEYFQSERCYMPEYWFLEYLFQFLQKSASCIGEQKQRDLIREKFYIELDRLLDILNQTVDDVRVEGNNILDLIKNDWEFAFTVNYYLRGEQFNQDQIKKVQAKIQRYIKEMQGK